MSGSLRSALLVPILGLVLACGGGGGGYGSGGSGSPSAPAAPAGLASTGALGRISLAWGASSGATGYHVYRSASGGAFAKLTTTALTGPAYDDTLTSPAADGVLYAYQVTALNAYGESPASAAVANMHGTRLAAASASGFTASPGLSPYVVDGTATVDGGDVTIPAGATLCLKPGSVLSLQDGATLRVQGTLRALGSAAAPATLNGHGFAVNNAAFGIGLAFDGAVPYNAGTGQGTLLDHAQAVNLALGDGRFTILNSAPAFQHCKFASNDPQGRTYLELLNGCGARFTRCGFTGVVATIAADLRAQAAFGVTQSTFAGGYYALYVGPLNTLGLAAGQFTGNTLNGAKDAVLYFVSAPGTVPLGGNFWSGGAGSPPLPAVNALGSTNTATLGLTPALAAAPSPVGPDW